VGPSDTFILATLTTTKTLSAAEARGVVGWWAAERKPDESLVAFLVRREVFAPTSAEMTRLLESGSPAPHQADNLFAERGVERLRKNLGLAESRPEPASLVDCLARPPRRVMDQADRRPAQSPRAARQPTPAVRAGTLLGKYLVVEQIGRGASCVVFRGLHRGLNLTVAIKVLPHESDPDDPVVRERFRAEARLQARLDHPNIVRVLDFEDEVALPYMVLEYVAGPTLADHIAKSGRVPPDQALKAVLQISEALAAANQIGVVHRDVKPANILLSADGRRAKLADLGLALVVGPARAAAASGTRRDTVVGTAAYIAPEQALSVPDIDHRADIYSLGATLYHALTGRLVFTGRSRLEVLFKHVREPVVPPEQLVPELGANVSAVVLKMMAKDAGARQQTYAELLGDLRTLVRRAPPAAPTPAAPAPAEAAPTSPATDSHTALNSSAWRKWFGSRPPPTGAPAR
jgi:serine/threonine protein kinase